MRRLTKIASSLGGAAFSPSPAAQRMMRVGPTRPSQDLCDGGGDGPKVGLAYDVGGRGDQSFNDSAAVGHGEGRSTSSTRPAPRPRRQDGEAESAREDRLRALAEAGHNPIIGVGFAYSDAANIVAPDFPEVSFAVVDGFDRRRTEPNDNVAYLGFAENEGSFLVGVAAALTTEADHVGFVGGVNNDLIKKFEAGYVAGVEAVNPDITVDVPVHRGDRPRGLQRPGRRQGCCRRRCTTTALTSSTTPPVARAPVSSTPRSRPATACGRSVSTPTSTSRPPRTLSRTS